jgi:hypothetical protein
MNVINLDIFLLIIGIPFILWIWVFRYRHLASQISLFTSTVLAQYSWLISWSLAKFCLFILAFDGLRRRPAGLSPFLPYVYYVLVASLLSAFFWEIPSGVSFFYGQARIFLSLLNFMLLVFATMSLSIALSGPKDGKTFWIGLRWIAVIHGVFFLYQYFAALIGLPLIGISRAHGLTLNNEIADVAAFVTGSGLEILRPGGLAGEPKTVAVVFGILLLSIVYVGHQFDSNKNERLLTIISSLLSFFCFFAAFSTSAFFGLSAAFLFMVVVLRAKYFIKIFFRLLFLIISATIVLLLIFPISEFITLLSERTIDRLEGQLDPPVEASIDAIMNSIFIALFGTGEGGSSFIVMKYLSTTFEYSYAPNIGIIRLLVENGFVGAFLFFGAYAILAKKALLKIHLDQSLTRRLFLTISISTMFLCMAGSGILLGIPLSIASIYAAQVNNK